MNPVNSWGIPNFLYNIKYDFDFLRDIQQAQFKKIGSFQLIDKEIFGKEAQYFVPRNEHDKKFEDLIECKNELHTFLKTQKEDRNKHECHSFQLICSVIGFERSNI